MKTKRINHKKIYDTIAKKFNIIYWKESWNPVNFTYFWLDRNDFLNREPAFIIEKIPETKCYFKIIYFMKIKQEKIINKIIDEIVEEYKKQEQDLQIDFNFNRESFLI